MCAIGHILGYEACFLRVHRIWFLWRRVSNLKNGGRFLPAKREHIPLLLIIFLGSNVIAAIEHTAITQDSETLYQLRYRTNETYGEKVYIKFRIYRGFRTCFIHI